MMLKKVPSKGDVLNTEMLLIHIVYYDDFKVTQLFRLSNSS